jgi:hypothetical protein
VKQERLEIHVENYLVQRCADRGWLCEKVGYQGKPDRFITLPCGHKPTAELKRRKGSTRRLQTVDHQLRWACCREIVFMPRSLMEVDSLIDLLDSHVLTCPALPLDLTKLG